MSQRYSRALDLIAAGRHEHARAELLAHLRTSPRDAGALEALAHVLLALGEPEQAAYHAERAVAAAPGDPNALANAATALLACGRWAEAAHAARTAIGIRPDHPGPHAILARALIGEGRLVEACIAGRDGPVPSGGGDIEITLALAEATSRLGEPEAAAAMLRTLRDAHPGHPRVAGAFANILNYASGFSRAEIADAHRTFGRLLVDAMGAGGPAAAIHLGTGERTAADRPPPLRIGLLSPDLREHPVGYFLLPLATHADRERVTIHAFATLSPKPGDSIAAELKSRCDSWFDGGRANDARIAEQIRRERIDILVDLAGLTHGQRFGVLMARPAPVAATYFGYPATTGLPTVDVRLVDALTDPPDHEDGATERLVRIESCYACYRPPADSPHPAPAPCLTNGHITFGSFNNLQKLTDTTLRLWARVLDAVPGSRLILKGGGLEHASSGLHLSARMSRCRMDIARVEIITGATSRADHIRAFARADIGLDPVPYCGTTTTTELLWAGLPLVTLVGQTHAARVGLTMLTAIGRPEWAADSESSYIGIAQDLAADRAALGLLRARVRAGMESGPLRDERGFATRFVEVIENVCRAPA